MNSQATVPPVPGAGTDRRLPTFSYAQSVVPTGHKVIQRDEQVGVVLAGPRQEVFFGVPTSGFAQALGLEVGCDRPLEGFWNKGNERKKSVREKLILLSGAKKKVCISKVTHS